MRIRCTISAAFDHHHEGFVVKTTFHDRAASHDDRRRRAGGRRPEDGLARRQCRARRQPGARGEGQARDRAAQLSTRRERVDAPAARRQDPDDRARPGGRGQPVLLGAPSCDRGFGACPARARLRRELRRGCAPRARAHRIVSRSPRRRDHRRPREPATTCLYEEQRAGTALVFVDRPAGHLDADSVVSNNVGGSVEAVEHLLAHGHRRIAFLGDLLSISTAARPPRGIHVRARAGRHPRRRARQDRSPRFRSCRERRRRAARAPRPADGALHEPEPPHDRRHPGAPEGRARTPDRADRLRRRRARRHRRAGDLGRRAGSAGDRPGGGRASLPATGRRHIAVRAPRHPGQVDRPRVGRDLTVRS